MTIIVKSYLFFKTLLTYINRNNYNIGFNFKLHLYTDILHEEEYFYRFSSLKHNLNKLNNHLNINSYIIVQLLFT